MKILYKLQARSIVANNSGCGRRASPRRSHTWDICVETNGERRET